MLVEEDEVEEDVGDGDVVAEVCEGEGEESKTMPLVVASAGWLAVVSEACGAGVLRCFWALPLKVTRAFSEAQLRSASLKRPSSVWVLSCKL